MAENELQRSTNKIMKWANKTGFTILAEKTKTLLVHRWRPSSITTYFEDMDGRMYVGDGQIPQNIGPDF
jgi:hypothetical protein